MHGNQQLPNYFSAHRKWILNKLQNSNAPDAWIFINDQWILQTTQHKRQRIEQLEYILTTQDHIGLLRFKAQINSKHMFIVLYLYDGTVFSHSIFQPMNFSDKIGQTLSSDKGQWWIEPWTIDHLLS